MSGKKNSRETDPDGPLAIYRCLWTSLGRHSGRRIVPRPVRFLYLVSVDFISFAGWCVIRRVAAGGSVSKLRRTVAGFGWVFVLPMAFAFLVDGILIYGLEPRGWVWSPRFDSIASVTMSSIHIAMQIALAVLAFRGRLPGTAASTVIPALTADVEQTSDRNAS